MEIRYADIPGTQKIVLPPLLKEYTPPIVLSVRDINRLAEEAGVAQDSEPDDVTRMLEKQAAEEFQEKFTKIRKCWRLGASILSWTGQCVLTFEYDQKLRPLVSQTSLWPDRRGIPFIWLLGDKIPDYDDILARSVGAALSLRRFPDRRYFSMTALNLLDESWKAAFDAWQSLSSSALRLPPDRFTFDVGYNDPDVLGLIPDQD